MASANRPRGLDAEPLNLTPLLDVLFNLIFFFLLATTLKQHTRVMEVQIPRSGVGSQQAQPRREWVITVGPKGTIFLNDDKLTSAQLKLRLSEAAKKPGRRLPVRIRSDRLTPAQALVDVMSICHESGFPDFGLEVKPEKGSP